MKTSVMGIVDTREQAESILSSLQQAGVATSDISILFPDKGGTRDFAHEHNTKAPEGAVAGSATGGVLGGTLGLLTGIGALAIPGLGPFIAAGPLMAALSGAAAGAAMGGVVGALVGMGIPEVEAKQYEGKIKGGNILIAVHVESSDMRDRVQDMLKNGGARDIKSTSEASVPKAAKEERIAMK
jgi:hypothetical protein